MKKFCLSLAALLLAACGGGTAQNSASPSGSASASPAAPKHYAIVLQDQATQGITFVREDNQPLGTYTLPPTQSGLPIISTQMTTAAGKFWFIAPNGHLFSVSTSGTQSDMGLLPDTPQSGSAAQYSIFGLAVSPDGTKWAYGVLISSSSGNGSAQTQIDVGGVGQTPNHTAPQTVNSQGWYVLGWSAQGIVASMGAIGIGGCCYLSPEAAGMYAVTIDPSTLSTSKTWQGCATSDISANGSFACVAANCFTGVSASTSPCANAANGMITVHRASQPDVQITATQPVLHAGWTLVDDTNNRDVFGVVHSIGNSGPQQYVIDTESGNLGTQAVTKLGDQVLPDGVLASGDVVVSAAPQDPTSGQAGVSVLHANGSMTQLGAGNVSFVGLIAL